MLLDLVMKFGYEDELSHLETRDSNGDKYYCCCLYIKQRIICLWKKSQLKRFIDLIAKGKSNQIEIQSSQIRKAEYAVLQNRAKYGGKINNYLHSTYSTKKAHWSH